MAWFTCHLRAASEPLVRFEEVHPYLGALLTVPVSLAHLARSRAANYVTARQEEAVRPARPSALPYHVVVDPSSICNLRCPLCVQATAPEARRRRLVDVGRFRDAVAEIADHAIRIDLFNWGEPMLHPRFVELVRIAEAAGLWTRTSTNLSLPRPLDADAVAAAGLRHLVVSVDGATQQTYERYRTGGSLRTVLDNLARLVGARDRNRGRPVIEWQYLALRHNTGEIEAARRMAADIGVDVFRCGGARGEMATKLRLSTAENVRLSRAHLLDPSHPLSEYDADGHKARVHETDGCRWLWGKASLGADGSMAPCVSSWFPRDDLASWHDGRVAAAWRGDAYEAARRAATGGGLVAPGSVCGACARHGNFVPTPDRDDEELPSRDALPQLVRDARGAGLSPADGVVCAVGEGLASPHPAEYCSSTPTSTD
jgi:MoaA/NifB/PqqE/SkfB family radical SAM enzyme